ESNGRGTVPVRLPIASSLRNADAIGSPGTASPGRRQGVPRNGRDRFVRRPRHHWHGDRRSSAAQWWSRARALSTPDGAPGFFLTAPAGTTLFGILSHFRPRGSVRAG